MCRTSVGCDDARMTDRTAELAVTAHVGQVLLALGELVHGVAMSWCDERRAWRLDVEVDGIRRVFWYSAEGWHYEWAGRSWWRPTLWPIFSHERLAAELVLVLAGLVSWPASTSDQHEGAQPGSEDAAELLVSQ